MALRTNGFNHFETTLTAEVLAGDKVFPVESTSGMASPAYLILAPNTPSRYEVVLMDGVFDSTTFRTTDLANRYLSGSAESSLSPGIDHPSGEIVRYAPVQQHWEQIWDETERIDGAKSETTHTHVKGDVASRAAKVYLGTAQSISNNTLTKVALDTAAFDPHGLFDSANNQIILDKAGMWVVQSSVRYPADATGSVRRNQVSLTGTGAVAVGQIGPSGAVLSVVTSVVVNAAANDVIELFAKQDSGAALNVDSGSPWTFLSVAYLGT